MQPRLRRLLIAAPIPGLALAGFLSLDRQPGSEQLSHEAVPPVQGEVWELSEVPTPEWGTVVDQASDRDRALFEERMAWARAERLDTLPLGEIIARLGRTFVGTTYTAGTLNVEGPERLVVNLHELDCVTFVENMVVMARLIKARTTDFNAYQAQLVRIRYRGGVLDGYPSRLHYFSDWIYDNESLGIVRDLTRELGGSRRTGRIDFMSTHPSSYPQLSDSVNLAAIQRTETDINRRTRYYIPQDRIKKVEDQIRDGDVIAMTSTVKGLDIVHTGIAVRVDGRVHLMHAPLVGKSVEISELPLAERIQRLDGQDGIVVARPGW